MDTIGMTTATLVEKLNLTKLSGETDKEIASCYISDLLSRVLGGCQAGDIWITVQSSLNMVAVAVMTEASCVILPEGLTASDSVVEKANEEDLTIFSSNDSAYLLAVKIAELTANP
jgi:predicted transcriptional regulator